MNGRGGWRALARGEDERSDEQAREWIRQSNLVYGGMAGAGTVMVQPFLATTPASSAARTCVVAFAVAIPLLAALLVLNRQESFRGRQAPSVVVAVTRAVAMLSGAVGLVAGFWHISPASGIAVVAASVVGVAAHSAGYTSLEMGIGEPLHDDDEVMRGHPDPARPSRPRAEDQRHHDLDHRGTEADPSAAREPRPDAWGPQW